MPGTGFYALLALIAVGVGLLAWRMTPVPVPPPVSSSGTALIGGPFALMDQNGNLRSAGEFSGRYMLVYFGFTTCPDICPTDLGKMGAALTQLEKNDAARAARVQPIFITVDPERDTVTAIKEYMPNFHPRLIGLTGTPAQIKAVMAAYRVYAQKNIPKDDPANYMMDHSSYIYLMGPDGGYITHFTNADSAVKIAKGIRGALS